MTTKTQSYLRIEREHLGDFDPVQNAEYKLTEFNRAMADMDKLAKAVPGRTYRMAHVTIAVIAERVSA